MFKNTIFVILNARLKTLDTIIPLMMDLDKDKTEIIYYSPNFDTTKAIKLNKVINDCVAKTGKLVYFYNNSKKYIRNQNYYRTFLGFQEIGLSYNPERQSCKLKFPR